jgi:hypothetical protein
MLGNRFVRRSRRSIRGHKVHPQQASGESVLADQSREFGGISE